MFSLGGWTARAAPSDGIERATLGDWLRARRVAARDCVGAPLELEGELTLRADGTSDFVVSRSSDDATDCLVRALGGGGFLGEMSGTSVTLALTISVSPVEPPKISRILLVHVRDILGVRGRRLPAEPCGHAIAIVSVEVDVLEVVSGEPITGAVTLPFTACAADVLRDRRIVGRDLYVRYSAGGWWVREGFDPGSVPTADP